MANYLEPPKTSDLMAWQFEQSTVQTWAMQCPGSVIFGQILRLLCDSCVPRIRQSKSGLQPNPEPFDLLHPTPTASELDSIPTVRG
jgi:hypothetical protein